MYQESMNKYLWEKDIVISVKEFAHFLEKEVEKSIEPQSWYQYISTVIEYRQRSVFVRVYYSTSLFWGITVQHHKDFLFSQDGELVVEDSIP